jgi:NAD(P)-dependent dehydrogenase (short-subunit alcohol dehydrogenase family)
MLDLVDHTEADFDRIIGIDLRGVFLCMKYEIPEMLKVGGGAIINCGSVASLIADPGMSVYVAAKHGIAGLTKGAALDYAKRNIRINAICPGFTDTPLTKDCPADMREIIKSFNAVNRISDPNEIAGIVLFLASDMASFITGAVIPVDGGQTAH